MIWQPGSLEALMAIEVQPAQSTQDTRSELVTAPEEYLAQNSRTLFDQGNAIAWIAALPLWTGVAQAVTLISEEALRHPVWLARGCAAYLDVAEQRFRYWRIQATVDEDHEAAIRFIEFLGFQNEGRLHKYGPDGSNHFMYARVTHVWH